MTRDLPAGRDLDALIAEQVMGLTHSECRAAEEDVWVSDDGVLWFVLPPYSTDIAAAWEVVEKLDGAGPRGSYWWSLGTKWRAEFYLARVFEGSVEIARREGVTMPLAICRAALKAVAT